MDVVAGAPWHVNVGLIAFLALITAIGPIISAKMNSGIKADLKTVKAQTENEHQGAEFPNLRDELTATREVAESVNRNLAELKRDVGGIREEMRHERKERLALGERIDGHPDTCPALQLHYRDQKEK